VPAETEYDLTTSDVASLLKLTSETIRTYADKGLLPCLTLPSGHRRFRIADVEPFMAPGEAAS
jgi:excisionase family DNA binding protein